MTDDMSERARLQLAMTGAHGGLIGNHATVFAHDAANVRRDQIIDHATERERAAWIAGRDAAAIWHDEREADEQALSAKYRGGSNPWFSHIQQAKFHKEAASEIRALTPPDAATWQPPPE
jgi:hypothetical protein